MFARVAFSVAAVAVPELFHVLAVKGKRRYYESPLAMEQEHDGTNAQPTRTSLLAKIAKENNSDDWKRPKAFARREVFLQTSSAEVQVDHQQVGTNFLQVGSTSTRKATRETTQVSEDKSKVVLSHSRASSSTSQERRARSTTTQRRRLLRAQTEQEMEFRMKFGDDMLSIVLSIIGSVVVCILMNTVVVPLSCGSNAAVCNPWKFEGPGCCCDLNKAPAPAVKVDEAPKKEEKKGGFNF
ncbi:unnamed protein product [Amoebophrya sp. A120]|nr:unnamed protein product [Amoebophrya sp. A120]|eukprot:GSA120T00009368001.1